MYVTIQDRGMVESLASNNIAVAFAPFVIKSWVTPERHEMPKKPEKPTPKKTVPVKKATPKASADGDAASSSSAATTFPTIVSSSLSSPSPRSATPRPTRLVTASRAISQLRLRPSANRKYLKREQCIEIYRWMLLNRKMESVLESLYKQSKVVGGVYFGLGQEGCSCASAYALQKDDWIGPMIRNQGALLVRGFSPADIMRQYMAKADSPTFGRDASSHFGDIKDRNVAAPISMLGELVGILAGVCLGARLQGRNVVGPHLRRRRWPIHRRHL